MAPIEKLGADYKEDEQQDIICVYDGSLYPTVIYNWGSDGGICTGDTSHRVQHVQILLILYYFL